MDSQRLAIRAISEIIDKLQSVHHRGDFNGGNSCSNQVRTGKSARAGEYTVCSEEKYELPRGTMPHKQATHLISPNPSSEESPWLTSYFPEEYTVCHAGTTQHKKCETVILKKTKKCKECNERNLNICTIR